MIWYKEPAVGVNPATGVATKSWTGKLKERFRRMNLRFCGSCGAPTDLQTKGCRACCKRHWFRKTRGLTKLAGAPKL